METKVVITTRDLFIGDERIAKGTELMVKDRGSNYYTISSDCLPSRVKKKIKGSFLIRVYDWYVKETEDVADVSFDNLLSVLEAK